MIMEEVLWNQIILERLNLIGLELLQNIRLQYHILKKRWKYFLEQNITKTGKK